MIWTMVMKGYCQTGLWQMLITRLNYWFNSGTYTNVMTRRLLLLDYVDVFLSQVKPPEWAFYMIQDSLPMALPLRQLFLAGNLRCRITQDLITWAKPRHLVLVLFISIPFLASPCSGVCHAVGQTVRPTSSVYCSNHPVCHIVSFLYAKE